MFSKLLLSTAMVVSMSLISQISFANEPKKCEKNEDCGTQVCYVVKKVCIDKNSLPAGEKCKKDDVCISKNGCNTAKGVCN
jgi:hypothetical protein